MRSLLVTLILLVAVCLPHPSAAQTGPQLPAHSPSITRPDGSSSVFPSPKVQSSPTDTIVSDTLLRPRSMGSYIVGCYPSPALAWQPVTVQTYNRVAETLSVTVYDNAAHPILTLIPQQTVAAGLQTLTIPAGTLLTGAYHVQLLTYTASGVVDVVDEARFMVAR